MISTKQLRNSAFVERLEDFANSSAFAKAIASIIIWVIALIPTWLYLFVRWGIGPVGFWQEFALFVISAIVIGWLQAILAFFGGVITIAILLGD